MVTLRDRYFSEEELAEQEEEDQLRLDYEPIEEESEEEEVPEVEKEVAPPEPEEKEVLPTEPGAVPGVEDFSKQREAKAQHYIPGEDKDLKDFLPERPPEEEQYKGPTAFTNRPEMVGKEAVPGGEKYTDVTKEAWWTKPQPGQPKSKREAFSDKIIKTYPAFNGKNPYLLDTQEILDKMEPKWPSIFEKRYGMLYQDMDKIDPKIRSDWLGFKAKRRKEISDLTEKKKGSLINYYNSMMTAFDTQEGKKQAEMLRLQKEERTKKKQIEKEGRKEGAQIAKEERGEVTTLKKEERAKKRKAAEKQEADYQKAVNDEVDRTAKAVKNARENKDNQFNSNDLAAVNEARARRNVNPKKEYQIGGNFVYLTEHQKALKDPKLQKEYDEIVSTIKTKEDVIELYRTGAFAKFAINKHDIKELLLEMFPEELEER